MRDRSGAIDQRREQEQDYSKLKEEVRLLRTLRGEGVGAQIDETIERVEAHDDDQSTLMKELKKDLESMRAGQERMKSELEQREHQSQMGDAQNEVVTWVKDQKEHFPLLNEIGQQALVFQKMMNEQHRTGQYISEAQAGREVEAEIRAIVERCAPVMGYTKSDVEQRREEQVSVGSGAMSMTDPLETNGLSDTEALSALVESYEKHQR
jgi:predicted phage gp36 major capsid-like protein